MEKNLQISFLLDFYGSMLTEKQREVVELYYNEDLSLAEIAQHSGITRQGVRDSIKRAERQLLECEERLGLMQRFRCVQDGLDEIIRCARELQTIDTHPKSAALLRKNTQRIIELAQTVGL